MEATRVFVEAGAAVEILGSENSLAHQEIVADEDAGNGTKKTGVAHEPGKNVTAIAGEKLPGLHEKAHDGGNETAGAKTDAAGRKIGKIVGGRDDVGGDIDVERGHQQNNHGENDNSGERRHEKPEEFAEGVKFRWPGEHGAEAARFAARPEKQCKADEEQERRRDTLEEADGFDAAQNHENVEKPEKNEANRCAVVKFCPAGRERDDHGVDGFAANPGLNAEPAASDQGSKNRGDVGAEHAERSPCKNGKGDAVLRSGMCVEKHGNQHEDVAKKNGEERLAPVHAAGNHAAGEHVGGDIDAHGDP